MSVNNGTIQSGNRIFNACLVAVIATLLWTIDGTKVIPTARQMSYAGILIAVALIMFTVIKKAMNWIKDPEVGKKSEATIAVVVSCFVLAAVGWVALMGWNGYEPRHAFAGMVTVLALVFIRWGTFVRKDEPTLEDAHPNDPEADKAAASEKGGKRGRELADTSA